MGNTIIPTPREKWPQWLQDADTVNAVVTIEAGRVIWHRGVWRAGAWCDGVWLGGTWRGGVWRDGSMRHENGPPERQPRVNAFLLL